MGFNTRYRSMKNRQAKDWWSITFGDPLSWMILGFIGDVKWITPIGITLLSFIFKIIPSILILSANNNLIVLGVLLLQFGQVLDSMDGNLARYRNETTLSGGFLDKILDGTGFTFVMSSFSWFIYQNGNEPFYIILGPMTSSFYLIVCYSYWTTAYQEHKYFGKTNKVKPGANVENIQHISTLKYIVSGQRKILSFKQADFYFWIGFGIIFELSIYVIWILFIALLIRVFERLQSRYKYLNKLDNYEHA